VVDTAGDSALAVFDSSVEAVECSTEIQKELAKLCIGRRGGVHGLITMEFWKSDADLFQTVWDTVLETLEIGEPVSDPLKGPPVH